MGMIHKAAAAMLAVALAGSAGAAVRDGAPVFKKNLFGDFVDINIQRATRINDLAQDSANQTWFATQGAGAGAAKIEGIALTTVGSPFPINTNDTGYPLSDNLSSVVFAKMGGQEHFFIGSPTDPVGLQAGRLTVGVDFVGNRLFTGAEDAINALATSGNGVVWVGAAGGLHLADISGTSPLAAEPSFAVAGPIRHLADVSAAFGGTAAAAYVRFDSGANSDVLGIHTTAAPTVTLPLHPSADRVDALFFQGDCGAGSPCLWAVEGRQGIAQRWIVRYDGLDTAPAIGMIAAMDRACIGDANVQDNCDPTDLAINSITGEFWLATRKDAFFQIPDATGQLNPRVCGPGADRADPSDDVFILPSGASDPCNDVGTGWRPVPKLPGEPVAGSPEENCGAVFADPAGNVWLGSDYGLRSLVVRYLTLSGTRFIGLDKRAVVTLEDGEAEVILDLPEDPDDIPDDPAVPDLRITVQVGATAVKFLVLPDVDGVYRLSFGFTSAADNDPVADPLHRFSVTPSVEGEDILVFYEFQDALGTSRKLEARATWAEIVPFEDDLWIGGPCFLDLLLPTRRGAAR